jgi:pimeloyl-ACP methyl ester carboxylesterase
LIENFAGATRELPMPKVHANGIDIYYEVMGAGEPLLLIAGFASDLTIWSKVAPSLAEQYQVIGFDNRGVGRSSAPDSPYSIRQMADDAAALLDQIGVKKAHVAGHSMGGMIAQELAIAHTEKVASLVLLGTCAKPDECNKAIIECWGELPRQVDPATAVRISLPWIYTNRFYSRPKAIQQVIDLVVASPFPSTPQGIYHQSRAVMGFDTSDRLSLIRCPTLVLAGEEDILLPVPCSEELARGIPGAELAVLANTGHGMLIETPDAVAEAMLNFLARPFA